MGYMKINKNTLQQILDVCNINGVTEVNHIYKNGELVDLSVKVGKFTFVSSAAPYNCVKSGLIGFHVKPAGFYSKADLDIILEETKICKSILDEIEKIYPEIIAKF